MCIYIYMYIQYRERPAAHCIKRNKTASSFLDKKSPKGRAGLFSMAREKSKELI